MGFRSWVADKWARDMDLYANGEILRGTLDDAVLAFAKQGYEIVYRDATMCQLKKGKQFKGWSVVGLGVLTAGLSVVPHALVQASKKDKIILLRLDAEGRVRMKA